ncbi:alpha-2-macroglobulin [Campylobacter sp. MIT 12-5580]|uniref:alpha-2-macroglobulin family protein n=1 Tax=Campylobacter sp. MIT 12-5580 TaxID=2040651 RepID=UPI0010FA1FF8|nr:MG2 domain-containing protein [Campylobacter sp. MIT 12-5580]TKX29794.1 alpha-2-macroglobulin [Campylobacter sp. MIT 12-5580]
MFKKLILPFLLMFIFIACKENSPEFIRAQTSGVIKAYEHVFVSFMNTSLDQEILSQNSIDAKINGKESKIAIRFDSSQTLLLYPDLEANKNYKIEFNIANIPVKLEFKTDYMNLNLENSKFISKGEDKSSLVIELKSSFENLNQSILAQSMSLTRDGKKIDFFLQNVNQGLISLQSEVFELSDKASKFTLHIRADKLGLKEDKDFHFNSPSKNKFAFINSKNNNDEIELEFSQALNEKQNFNDLISIEPKIDFKAFAIGNKLKINAAFLPQNEYKLTLSSNLSSNKNTKLEESTSLNISFGYQAPAISFSSDGVFLPSLADKKIAFKSLNINKARLKVYQIYANTLHEYLRYKNFTGKKGLSPNSSDIEDDTTYTSDLVLEKEFKLDAQANTWVQNEIKLDALKDLKGAFIVELSFKEEDLMFPSFFEDEGYEDWEKDRFFYRRAIVSKNLVFSDLGIMAEAINDQIFVRVNNYTNLNALNGVKIEAINRKNQVIASAISDVQGQAVLDAKEQDVLFIIASKGEEAGILRLSNPLSTDGFDVSGAQEAGLIEAFIYTDRGVYRPGDNVHLNIVARNKKAMINHPIILKSFKDPQSSTLLSNITLNPSSNGMFYQELKLAKDAATGIYELKFDIASQTFSHKILVQTIAPNRIAVQLHNEESLDINKNSELEYNIEAKYLFGAPAAKLKAQTTLNVIKDNYKNPKFTNYIFQNPSLYISEYSKNDDGVLDENGKLSSSITLGETILNTQGTNFKALLTSEVFETGGRSTKALSTMKLEKYKYFIGIKELENYYINSGDKISFSVIASDLNFNTLKGKKITYKIYKNSSSWWFDYDNYSEFLRSIKKDKNTQIIAQGEITSSDKPVSFSFDSKDYYGEMFVELVDNESGVSTGERFYVSSWGAVNNADIVSSLKIKSDKDKYQVGEKAIIEFESTKNSKAFITISNNKGIIKQFSLEPQGTSTKFELDLSKEYAPNVYVSVSLLQDYNSWQNDRALRLFGVVPVLVEDKATKLELDLKAPDKILPQSEFELEIQSKDKKAFTYTLAIVDEGLLSLSDFETPDIWGYFYAKTGFKLKVFDTYEQIIAKTLGKVSKVLSTGGDLEASFNKAKRANKNKADEQAERFKAVVLYQAPIQSDKKGYAKLKFQMPAYMGAVRVMLIASNGKAFGSTEKEIIVSAPVSVLETFPRSLRINDKFEFLAQVFKNEENVTNASLSLKSKNKLLSLDKEEVQIAFNGDEKVKNIIFNIAVNDDKLGLEELELELKSKDYHFKNTSQIDVKAINAYTYEGENFIIKPNEKKEFHIDQSYIKGSTQAVLELSSTPILNLNHRLKYLIAYPYGCIEQTTSAVLPQLYLDELGVKINKQKVIDNINAALTRYTRFQTANGGFAYWQGGKEANAWGSNYAGLFMILAKNNGFYVSDSVYNAWLEYQKDYIDNNLYNTDSAILVNSLYLLALVQEPNIAAMNAVYEQKDRLSNTALWQLGAAYKLAGLEDIALKLVANASFMPNSSEEFYRQSYGSDLRDKAIILASYIDIYNKINEPLFKELSEILGTNTYLNTQNAGYMLYALAKGANLNKKEDEAGKLQGTLELLSNAQNKTLQLDDSKQSIEFSEGKAVLNAKNTIYGHFGVEGIKLELSKPFTNKINISRSFYNEKGEPIDESKLQSSQNFYMRLDVSLNNAASVQNLALTQVLPSGWEVANTLLDTKIPRFADNSKLDFIDIRDDKIMWFFDLSNDETKSFFIKLTAVTPGEFTLSGAFAEAMYDNTYQSLSEGKKVIVSR